MALINYKIFSNETWKQWDKTGKTEVVLKLKELIKENEIEFGNASLMNYDSYDSGIPRALYEVLSAVIKGNLHRDFAKPVLLEVLNWHPDIPSVMVEVISILDLEVSTIERLSKQKDQLYTLMKMLNLEHLLKERLEIETLDEAAIVKGKKTFLTKQIKVRTKIFYKQQKFNLLREESEGYSKLITELHQDFSDITPTYLIQVIRSLIGSFNLDPNRVLDLILEAFENRPEEFELYTALLLHFPHESATLNEIICFKLNNMNSRHSSSRGFFIILALLMHKDILKLENVYAMLTPEDSSLVKKCTDILADAKDYARKANIISTKDKDKDKESEKEDEIFNFEYSYEIDTYNQKIQLAAALLEVGNWRDFIEISNKFPKFFLVSFPHVAKAFCKYMLVLTTSLYRAYCGLPSVISRRIMEYSSDVISAKNPEGVEELISIVFPMLHHIGPFVCYNVNLVNRLTRICRTILNQKNKLNEDLYSRIYYEVLTLLDVCLLPCLSMFSCNPCLAEEIWEVVKLYPYQHRYKLYANWKNESYLDHPILIKNRTKLLKKAKYVMMRVTRETVKPVSRSLGKLSHNFPGPVLEYVLKQVQLYDNLIGPIVDSFKYLNSLSHDVLGYCIVEAFCSPADRTVGDGAAIAQWLQSLSNFTGSVCKKYSLDLGAILQFVANRLKCEHSTDLLILKDIVQKMAGSDFTDDLTQDQIEAMCGGELLRKEAGQYQQEKNTKKSIVRLKDALLENNLAVPLLLLMAQQRSSIIFRQTDTTFLKLIGKLYDQCQATLVQFGSFLTQAVTIEELSAKLPPIGELLSNYKISTDVAFFLNRPMLINILNAKYEDARKREGKERKLNTDDKKKIFISTFNDVLAPVSALVKPHYEIKVWEDLSINLFLAFWILSISDLEVPVEVYDREQKKIVELLAGKNKRREAERLASLKDKLEDEKKRQIEHVDRVNFWFNNEKDDWFKNKSRNAKHDVLRNFLQHCIFPRCIFTALDAIYCAKFIKMVHSMKTEYFSTLLYLDMLFVDITYSIASCTEQEAKNYALFLHHSLELVMHWHSSQDVFNKECVNFPGFITKYKVASQENNDYVDYENYRHVVYKWHYKITKALAICLGSGEYIQIRNSILFLQGVLSCYPITLNLANVINKKIEKVKLNEKTNRNDLYVLANSYSGRLRAKLPSLIPESEFHIVNPQEKPKPEPKKENKENGIVNGETEKSRKSEKSSKDEKRKLEESLDEENERKKKDDKSKAKEKDKKKAKKSKADELENDHDEKSEATNGTSKRDNAADEASRSSKRRKIDESVKTSSKKSDTEKKRKTPELISEKDAKKAKSHKKKSASPSEDKKESKSHRKSSKR